MPGQFIPVLKINDLDRVQWFDQFAPPFDPYVENVECEGGQVVVLRATRLAGFDEQRQLIEASKMMVRDLNNLVSMQAGSSSAAVDGLIERTSTGYRRHYYLQLETGTFRLGGSPIRIRITDAHGNDVTPEPKPSASQEAMAASAKNELLQDAIRYMSADADWFDLYKAAECLWSGGWADKRSSVMKRFRSTANMYRHRVAKDAPDNPMTIDEARSLLRSLLAIAVRKVNDRST